MKENHSMCKKSTVSQAESTLRVEVLYFVQSTTFVCNERMLID